MQVLTATDARCGHAQASSGRSAVAAFVEIAPKRRCRHGHCFGEKVAVVIPRESVARLLTSATLLLALVFSSGCASLRLNGCRLLEACGDRSAYACGHDLVCADGDGNTIRSEPLFGAQRTCRVCQGV